MTTSRDDTPTRLESAAAAALLRSQAAEIERLRAEANTCGSGAGCCAQAAEIERMKAEAELFARRVGLKMERKNALLREALRVIDKAFDYDGDVFGLMHNDAGDLVNGIETELGVNEMADLDED